jgi:hypothetical protein
VNGVFLFIFVGFWSTLVLLFDGIAGHGLWKQFESGHYPFTMGQVTHSEMTTHHGRKGTSYGVNIQYRYEVNGHAYSGSRFRYGTTSSDQGSALEAVSAHKVGSQTRVYFNPGNPEEALLSPDVEGSDLIQLLFLMPFNMVMAGLWTALGAWLRQAIFHPAAGGVKIITDGPRTSIRLPQYGALVLGMGATGILSFITVFIVGFATGFRPSVAVACLALLLVIGAGVAAYLWQWSKIHSGEDDLILDETSATITLPKTFGRKERVQINRGEIDQLTVETVEHRTSKGTTYTYAPTLWLKQSQAGQKLADWSERKRAEAFVEWLGQKLNLRGTPSTTDLSMR